MRREFWRHFDFWLFGAVVLLSVFGIVMIRSAIAGSQGLAGLDTRQAIYVGMGLIVILATALIDYHYWAALTRIMYIGAILIDCDFCGRDSTLWVCTLAGYGPGICAAIRTCENHHDPGAG
jgi:cell division protein FtsW (lipid II flippase)